MKRRIKIRDGTPETKSHWNGDWYSHDHVVTVYYHSNRPKDVSP